MSLVPGKSSSTGSMVMEPCGVASCDCFGGDTSRGGRRIEVPSDGRIVAPNVRQQFCVPAGNVEVFDCLKERPKVKVSKKYYFRYSDISTAEIILSLYFFIFNNVTCQEKHMLRTLIVNNKFHKIQISYICAVTLVLIKSLLTTTYQPTLANLSGVSNSKNKATNEIGQIHVNIYQGNINIHLQIKC